VVEVECILVDGDSRDDADVLSFEDGEDDDDVSIIESLETNS